MSFDPADALIDRRPMPPEDGCRQCSHAEGEAHASWCPDFPSEMFLVEREYYGACDAWDAAPEHCAVPAPECPICELSYPQHTWGCWLRGEGQPAYRLTPASFDDTQGEQHA